jgi:peptidoglycan/LPS O-acetylase OafA/YrhL
VTASAGPVTASAEMPAGVSQSPPAPAAVAPPPGHPRFPLIDSVRGLAALAIVFTHTATFSGFSTRTWWGSLWHNLDLGVPVFFVISGFLLYRPLLAADVLGAPGMSTLSYAWRRLLRIVPAYWLALTLLAWYANLPGVFTHDWWRYYLFLQIYSVHTIYGGLTVAWTLCVEVTFYAFLPLYAIALRRLSIRARLDRIGADVAVLIGLGVISIVARALDLHGSQTVLTASILENFDWFALGMLLATLSVAQRAGRRTPAMLEAISRHPGLCWLAALGLYAVLAAVVAYPVVSGRGTLLYELPLKGMIRHVAFGVIAVLIVAPAAFAVPRSVPARVLGWRSLAWLGLISYGIYLWHNPLLGKLIDYGALGWAPHATFVVITAATIAFTVLVAATSYYTFERPLLSFKNLVARRR